MEVGQLNSTLRDYKKMNMNVHMDGQKVPRDHEAFMPRIKLMGLIFDLATQPEWEDLATDTSHITDKKTNRFCHIHGSPEDLMERRELTRKLQRYTGICVQRCGGAYTISSLSVCLRYR